MSNPYEAPRTDAQLRQDACCSYCEESYRDVGPLVEGPDLVYICEKCCDEAIATHNEMKQPGPAGQWCSFCRKEGVVTGAFFTAESGVQTCAECADLVQHILEQELNYRDARNERSRERNLQTRSSRN
jgi:ATP-dependent protease Clp ATPase subunit